MIGDHVKSMRTHLKDLSEKNYDQLEGVSSLDFVLMYFYNVYGPGEADYGPYSTVIRKFKKDYLQGNPLTIYGNGKKQRDFTHVNDVIQGLLQLMVDQEAPSVAHFGKGNIQRKKAM